ncbi:MAG: C-type lectin domain-containing protein [Treponema sp.]|nr:C-type lectin domain-containing protein [Treponema sp.]
MKAKSFMILLAAMTVILSSGLLFADEVASTKLDGHTYTLYDNACSWAEAKSFCEEQGGHLATIASRSEQKAIVSLLKSGKKNYYWIGATRGGKTGRFTWITGEPFSYADWDPKAESDTTATNKKSLMIYKSTGRWCDENGDKPSGKASYLQKYGFICEWEGDAPLSASSAKGDGSDGSDSSDYAILMEKGDSIRLGSGSWKSSDTSIIKISKKGKATAIGEGMVTLASSAGMKLVIKVVEEE